jgi:GTP-binding protein
MIKCSDKNGDLFILSDLPGYGYAKVSKKLSDNISQFVSEYFVERDALKSCLVLVDPRRGIQDLDLEMIKVSSFCFRCRSIVSY